MSNSFSPDDELISAYLDGEVTEDERAAIEADQGSMALVAELRNVRDAVAAPVTPMGEADRERLLAAALAASETSETVTAIAVARERRRRFALPDLAEWGSRNRRPLIAVAAVLAIALAVPLARNLDLGGDATEGDQVAATADEPAEESADDAAAASLAGDADAVAAAPATTFEAAAEEPAEEPADEPADEAADEPAAEPASDGGIEFAPLTRELGEFDSVDLLIERMFADYEGWLEDPGEALSRAGGDELPLPSCLEELMTDGQFAQRFGDQTSDVAVGSVDGQLHEVWLFEDGTVYLAPVDACLPITEANFFES